MLVTAEEVAAILVDPEVEYGSGAGVRPFTAQRGVLAVGFREDPLLGVVVLTVLYRTQDLYDRSPASYTRRSTRGIG